MDPNGNFTELLGDWGKGDPRAREQLAPLIYQELRRLAQYFLQGERAGHTLQATALVHEAYLRLVDQRQASRQNREQFFNLAAHMMRRVLVDYARGHQAAKRGKGQPRLGLEAAENIHSPEPEVDLLLLDHVLTKLTALDAVQGQVVELRYFVGLTIAETAAQLNISEATVERKWRVAKAWLARELRNDS